MWKPLIPKTLCLKINKFGMLREGRFFLPLGQESHQRNVIKAHQIIKNSNWSLILPLLPPNSSYINHFQENAFVRPHVRSYSDRDDNYDTISKDKSTFSRTRPKRLWYSTNVDCRLFGFIFLKCPVINSYHIIKDYWVKRFSRKVERHGFHFLFGSHVSP